SPAGKSRNLACFISNFPGNLPHAVLYQKGLAKQLLLCNGQPGPEIMKYMVRLSYRRIIVKKGGRSACILLRAVESTGGGKNQRALRLPEAVMLLFILVNG